MTVFCWILCCRMGVAWICWKVKKMHKRENVIILSAKDSIEDKVLGLDLGADDYLPKPFHLVELNARIKKCDTPSSARWGK